ncbi:MAG: UDP-glucose 4-epimerase GalE [Rhodanobacter sp. SCN 68-63]|nr:MAG: UDP-glucose 4-epimerase GalE [Rhodanobacter sp. SCN 68-63]
MSHVLVCGGAGYIGSHMVRLLTATGHGVTVFDNLSTGHRQAIAGADFIEGDLLDPADLARAFSARPFDAVMHFAALSIVGESVREPVRYYRNNVAGTMNLVAAMHRAGVARLVFSSTAAVYGMSGAEWIDEDQPLQPINPYGASKAMAERVIADACKAHGMGAVALRYFNAAGADPSGEIGESHSPETHLIPNVLRAALDGSSVGIFGRDYPTPDGTCIRDYVHVCDLAEAHRRALDYLEARRGFHVFNLGSGTGFSVLQVLEQARRISGRNIASQDLPRRDGDPVRLVASGKKAAEALGWDPRGSALTGIVESAWRWHRNPRY